MQKIPLPKSSELLVNPIHNQENNNHIQNVLQKLIDLTCIFNS